MPRTFTLIPQFLSFYGKMLQNFAAKEITQIQINVKNANKATRKR